MTTISDGTKLDLSRLTDEEARHVWEVIQRDFNLRKKEEERLGDLKSKIVKEDTKRELLGYQSNLSDSICIHCLNPFKFLLNTKHQCLDCKHFMCKSCSRFNKKEHGWICNPCQTARLLKIGTLEWFHENLHSRFKRFGSAKVMKSLFKRLNDEQTWSQTDLKDDDSYWMTDGPDVHSSSICSQEDEHSENMGREHYRLSKKGKRLLLVDPQDFKLGTDPSTWAIHFYHHSYKNEKPDQEEDWSAVFQQILDCKRDGIKMGKKRIHQSSRSLDDCTHPENKMVRACSLSKMSHSSTGSVNVAFHELPYSVEDSEEDDVDSYPKVMPLNSEYLPEEISELNKRMSAIETLLCHLEQKITVPIQTFPLLEQAEPVDKVLSLEDQEEFELKRKLELLTENISDKGLSSDEDETNKSRGDIYPSRGSGHENSLITRRETPSLDKYSFSCEVQKVNIDRERLFSSQKNLNSCELSQLENKVALTVASVQSTKSGVTDIQNRIAALSATGKTEDRTWMKAPVASKRRMSHDLPIRARHGTGSLRKLSII